ncbi:rho GTPase-activating protein 5-like [Clytia hemisphaerica]|uniref:Rho GTPase-activating protein 5 n=1 Tax=Clytia hemisphaerica TaxID=252671 RepID=A0A7M6DQA9_9CNID
MSNKKSQKEFTICVVGLSGYDNQEKRLYGVGKSCFCNRLVRPAQDEYYTDHASVFSTSDFVGTVLNSDHFLYWGTAERNIENAETKGRIKIIEHTEFIDDASYSPLSKGGQLAAYTKRATSAKISSSGKMMYISRDQVALQNEFEEKQMEEKLQVDAFVCIYDVSTMLSKRTHYIQLQEEVLSNLLSNIAKTKKPAIIVASKCDKGDTQILQRAQNFVTNKKLNTQLVESSSELDVNVDYAFQVLWSLLDTKNKHRVKPKPLSYQEGLLIQNEKVSGLNKKYLNLIQRCATENSLLMSWKDFQALHGESSIFKEYILACGSDKAQLVFNQQAKKIKRHHEDKKLNEFLNKLPDALDELLPTIQSIEANDWKWENCQKAIKNHLLFDKWFQVLPQGVPWNSNDQLFKKTDRIPFDVLQVERSRACFDRHYKKLRESARKSRMKVEFRKLLELTLQIRPGTSWADASTWISNEESYKCLDEMERKVIFETYLREITYNAKTEFQELLFESANKFSKLNKESRPSESEMRELYEYLQDDSRYKDLENLDNARDILLFNHIALMQSPNRCLSGPEKCMDRRIQHVVEMTERRTTQNPYENEINRENEDELLNLLIIGKNGLGRELEEKIRVGSSSCEDVEYIIDGQIYGLNLKVHDVSQNSTTGASEVQSIITDFRPQGYLAIYSSPDSLRFIKECLKEIEEHENQTHTALPLIVLLANEAGTPESEIQFLRNEGHNLANSLQCIFLDYPYTVSLMDDRIHSSQVEDSLRGVFDIINKRSRPAGTPGGTDDYNCDVRILLCSMCGDEYSLELILSSMLQQNNCYSNPEKQDTIMLEAMVDGVKKTIAVTLGSYHRAYGLKNQMFHGFILVYSAKRLASLETLKAYVATLPRNVPVQVLAVTGSSSAASILFHKPDATYLLHDDTKLSTKLLQQQTSLNQANAFVNFFRDVCDKKTFTERILQGVKKRRLQEPLPDIPTISQTTPTPEPRVNGDGGSLAVDDDTYASINDFKTPGVDSPYVEVAISRSYIEKGSDSSRSSPDRRGSFVDKRRSRTSTCDSSSDVLLDTSHDQQRHDEGYGGEANDVSGMYAQVDKKKTFSYLKKLEQKVSSDDEDDEVIWKDNDAYLPVNDEYESIAKKMSDSPYATVPFLPKGHRGRIVSDYEKYNTLPLTRAHSDSQEPGATPGYRNSMHVALGRDQDAVSLSSKSKDSSGSLPELPTREKTSSMSSGGGETKSIWYIGDKKGGKKKKKNPAPIARPEDDENDDISDLRQKLEDALITSPTSATAPPTTSSKNKKNQQQGVKSPGKDGQRKSRSESNQSTSSLDPRNMSFMKKIMNKVSPNPSPVNSDVELDTTIDTPTTPKKRSGLSIRKRRQSPSHHNNQQNSSQPVITVDDSLTKERSNTLPTDSPRTTRSSKFGSLDNRGKSKSSIFKRTSELSPSENEWGSHTMDRRQSKKKKLTKSKHSKDDLDLPLGETTIDKKKRSNLGRSFRKAKSNLTKSKHGDSDMNLKAKQWEAMKQNQNKAKNQNSYFGKNLADIIPQCGLCPIFVEKAIKHVETNGMNTVGIYRQSGNKNDIKIIMDKFDADNNINLHELGISVHAVTGALKNFFNLLPEPLVPYEFGKKINTIMSIMDAEERLTKLGDMINQMPPVNHEVFLKTMCHLHRVSLSSSSNMMDTRNLQIVLYPTLMRPEFKSLSNISQNMNMALFVQTCIEQAERLFGVSNVQDMSVKITEAPSTSSLANILDESTTANITSNRLSSISITSTPQAPSGGEAGKNLPPSELNDSYELVHDEPSFSETVLAESGLESVVNSARSDGSSSKKKADSAKIDSVPVVVSSSTPTATEWKSFETAI